MEKRNILRILAAAAALILLSSSLSASDTKWLKVSGGKFTLYVSASPDIDRLYKNLRTRRIDNPVDIPENANKKEKIALFLQRIGKIFEEVKDILKFDIKLTGKERIVILKDEKQLRKIYKKFYTRPYDNALSFYSPKRKTIYTTEKVFCARILAHEMTHMVNDLHYKGTLPVKEDEKRAYKMEVYF